jgi:hypothetical protein
MDRLDIKPGQRWDRAVEDTLAKCPQLLVILSPGDHNMDLVVASTSGSERADKLV